MRKAAKTALQVPTASRAGNPIASLPPKRDYAFFRKEFFNKIGHKQTFCGAGSMSALPPKRTFVTELI
jgi:hypothetical protein